MSAPGVAVSVSGVSKRYRLYHERNDSLKASIMRRGRARYEEFWALRDVSFEIPQGTAFGLVGENGSGKSTMLKCIARILKPDEGAIQAEGKISTLLELGAGFHPELSGRDNIFLNGSVLGLSKRQITARFDEIVDFAGLEQFIDIPVKNYSSGMYMRLGFSIAINVDPDILLVDEVFAVGDAEFQRRSLAKLSDLQESGKTIVLVTHALSTVREFCEQAALLQRGRLITVGPAASVVDQYLSGVFTAEEEKSDRPRVGIHQTEMVDPAGRRLEHLRTGDPLIMRLHYEVPEPPSRPRFALAVHTLDGIELSHTSTRGADLGLDSLKPTGYVDIHIDRLPLMPGEYDVTTALADGDDLIGVPDRERITIEPSGDAEERGIVSLGVAWDVAPDGGGS